MTIAQFPPNSSNPFFCQQGLKNTKDLIIIVDYLKDKTFAHAQEHLRTIGLHHGWWLWVFMACLANGIKQINIYYHFSRQVEKYFSWLLIHVCCSSVTCTKVGDVFFLPNPFTSSDYQRVMTMPWNQGQFSSFSISFHKESVLSKNCSFHLPRHLKWANILRNLWFPSAIFSIKWNLTKSEHFTAFVTWAQKCNFNAARQGGNIYHLTESVT